MVSSLRVVLADDHPLARYGMRRALEANGIARVVAEAGTTDELFAALARQSCDVVVADFSMPGVHARDGIAMVERLIQQSPGLAIIVVAAPGDPVILKRLVAQGVGGLFDKADDIAGLQRALMTATRGRTYLSPNVNALLVKADAIADEAGPGASLSRAETIILRLFAYEGLTAMQISERLNRSVKTVSRHKRSAQEKLGLHTDQKLLEYCHRNALLPGAHDVTASRNVTDDYTRDAGVVRKHTHA